MQKILIIRFSSIGDIVLTTPVIRGLKLQAKAEVHYLTKKNFLPILATNPYIDKIYTIDQKVNEVFSDLRKEGYDLIIDLHKNLRSMQVRLGLFSIKSYTFDKLNFSKWLLVNFKINRLPKIHIVDRYLASVDALGIVNDGLGLDYFLPSTGMLVENIPKNYLVFAIGATHTTKRLPLHKIIEFCQAYQQAILLIGGSDVREMGRVVERQCSTHVKNYCGQLSIHESAYLIKNSTTVISHDTGMMHIAAAFQKPIISIWGNTVPDFGMYPYYAKDRDQNTTLEVSNLSCRPCSKIGYAKCPKGHFKCMNDMSFGEIIEKTI